MDSGTLGIEGPVADGAGSEGARQELDRRESDRARRRWLAMPDAGPLVKWLYVLMAVLLIAYVASELVRRTPNSWPIIDNWAVAFFEILGSALCLARGFVQRDRARLARAVPIVLVSALMAWSIGDLVLPIAGASGSTTPPLANVLYLCFYPLAYVGVMLRVHLSARRLTAETWLDGIIAGLGAAALIAAFLFHTILRAAGGNVNVVTTNLAFPIGDLLLLALVIGGSAVLPGRRRLPWMMLAVGLAANTLGDTANLFVSGLGGTQAGQIVDAVAWPTSILLVSLSVWVNPRGAAPIVGEQGPSFVFPVLASITSMAMLFVGSLEHISPAALAVALATLTAAGVRAGLSVRSLQRLTLDKHRQAVTDQLTTLANRRALYELLDALEEEYANTGERRRLACLFVDLNRFKEVNDSFGHSVGDELLRHLSERLSGTLRDGDMLARLGGDEFVVALIDAGGERGAIMAQRIAARLHEPVPARTGARSNRREHRHRRNARRRHQRRRSVALRRPRDVPREGRRAALCDLQRGARRARQSHGHGRGLRAPRSPPVSPSSCTTSRRSSSAPARSWRSKRWCAGAYPRLGMHPTA